MTQSALPPPSPGYEAFKEVDGVDDLLAWHRLVSAGRLPFNPQDTQYQNGPDALGDVLESLSHKSEEFEKARPVLDWLVNQGLSPFRPYSARGDSAYRNLCLWGASDALLDWCWSQPCAPSHIEPEVSQRVRSDALEALLLERPQLGSQWQLDALEAKGFALTETWADGRTTFDRMLCLDLSPDDWLKRFDQDRHMELEFMRGYRRLASALQVQSPQHPGGYALYLLAAMQGFRSDHYLKTIRADRAWESHPWHAPLRGLMSDIARSFGFKGKAESQHAQVWQASLGWAQQQPQSLVLAGAVLGASQVQCRNETMGTPSDSMRRRGWDIMMEAGAAIGPHLEGVTEEAMAEAYATFSWQTGFQLALEIIKNNSDEKQALPSEMFSHPGIWPLALPNTAFFSALNGEIILSYALGERNVWPRTPTFMRMADNEKLLDHPRLFGAAREALAAQHAQCRQETLEGVWPQAEGANPKNPRVRM